MDYKGRLIGLVKSAGTLVGELETKGTLSGAIHLAAGVQEEYATDEDIINLFTEEEGV